MCPGHTDHIKQTFGNGMPCRGHIRDTSGMKSWQTYFFSDFPGKIQMWCTGHALNRDHIGQAGVRINMSANNIQKIYMSRRLQGTGNSKAIFFG